MKIYTYYIYFSDKRNTITCLTLKEGFKKYLQLIKNEKIYIAFGVNNGTNLCDLAFNEYVKTDNKSHVVISNDMYKIDEFKNDKIVITNVRNVMLEMI